MFNCLKDYAQEVFESVVASLPNLSCVVPDIKIGITSLLYCKYTSSIVTFYGILS